VAALEAMWPRQLPLHLGGCLVALFVPLDGGGRGWSGSSCRCGSDMGTIRGTLLEIQSGEV
jgi:hypothetical protein